MAIPSGDVFAEEIIKLCWSNAEHFKKDDSESGQRLRLAFLGIVDHVKAISPMVEGIRKVMSEFDFNEDTPGNGYRSFVAVVDATFKHTYQLCSYVAISKNSIIFRKGLYTKEVEAASHMIASLAACFQHLQTILSWSEPNELFPSALHNPEILLEKSVTINQYAFYGRCLGIQFCSSVQPLLKFISTFMASFSEIYYNVGGFSARAHGLVSGGKFILDPELRARRIVNISQFANIDFCKSFWFLAESELMKKIPDFVCNSIAINSEVEIPPEPLQITNLDGEKVDIPIPSSHVKVSPVQVRLLSSFRREGMISVSSENNKKNPVTPTCECLLLHCHGGGFVAQSSKSHEVYLRDWASSLQIPIVSIDYSLAPEAPFPRALEEVFYAYCWTLKNSHLFGSTGEKIILAGDSAGANLMLGVALKCIEYNIKKPHGLFLAYLPVIVSSTPSPSRLLSLMDPLLPIGFLLRCLKAYACPQNQQTITNEESVKPETEVQPEKPDEIGCEATGNSADELLGATDDADHDNFVEAGLEFYPLEASSNDNSDACDVENHLDEKKSNTGNDFSSTSHDDMTQLKEENKKNSASWKNRMSNMFSSTFNRMMTKKDVDKDLTGSDDENLVNPFKEFQFSVPKDPYLSPYWASDDVLSQLPPTSICSVQFDPCLDDCVSFAKKLKKLGKTINLDILDGLPHGFLNFSKVNKDAEDGSKLCVERIKTLLNSGNSTPGSPIKKENEEQENHENRLPDGS